ncbi:X-linked retinitis pigmentosa GTPase regulator isoform X2 [Hyla sarda]|uniref:X-linked retinitis pigmentosa GTPase regulator isoform X2 n=1 Tax=Hyla sarda TaxID=327740 RepID=UPI0024C31847|nr:X-linked retinitis pigmentosa GTPase regulator isoform X2 [Hyla sarda]
MAAEEEEKPVPDSGAIFTFGKSKFAENCPSKFWLKNDKPAYIACGDEHTALVTGHGKLYVFGSNINGQLGIGSGNVITKPTCVKALKSEKIKLAACGRNHTLVCTAQGKIYSSGWNSEGQLGLGDTTERSSFHEILFFNGQNKIKQLSAGSNTSAALTVEGKLYMWGENSEGQLGLGDEKNICTPQQIDAGKPISWVYCGYYHSAFVTQDGELYTFGEPESGKLGLSAEKLDKHRKPQRVSGISGKVKMVACGGGHTVAVTDKAVYTFGLGQFGQLGHDTSIFETNTPKEVDALKLHKIRYVACGENHTAVITDKGLLYTFGDGRYGKLGLGEENFTNQFSPTLCKNFLKFTIQSVACGGCHMLVFAIPRPKESELVICEELKENYLMVNGEGERSTTLQRSPSARVRRREKKYSPEQIRELTRTLPPLKNNLLESSLPVPSRTVPPNLLKVRQVSSESSAHDSATASQPDKKQRHDLVQSFSADDESETVSQQSFGGTTDILNMTHAVSMNRGNSTFSPVHKRKKADKGEEEEEDEVEDEEEEEEVEDEEEVEEEEVEEEENKEVVTVKTEPKAQEGKPEEQVNTAQEATQMKQEESTAITNVENELEQDKTVNGVNSSENNSGKTTFLEKTRRLSLFKKRSTTSQKSLQENGNVAAASNEENSEEKSRIKESKDENQNGNSENPKVTTDTGQNSQDRKSKSCVLL